MLSSYDYTKIKLRPHRFQMKRLFNQNIHKTSNLPRYKHEKNTGQKYFLFTEVEDAVNTQLQQ